MNFQSSTRLERASVWFRRSWHFVLIVALVLLAVRLVLPRTIKSLINQRLEKIPEYAGHVEDIDLSIWRGAYQLEDVEIVKTNGETREPFFKAGTIDFSLAWRDLFRGRFVGDFVLEDAELIIVNAPTEESSQTEVVDKRWQDAIEDIFPIEITRLEIKDSRIRFIDTDADPKVDIALDGLEVVAKGLRNRPSDKRGPLPAEIELRAKTIGNGDLRVFGGLDLLAQQPRFKLNLELINVDLPALNDFLLAYGNVDVASGDFQLFLEVAAAEGQYEGYVKPFFDHLDFKNVEDKSKPVTQRLWEKMVSGLSTFLKNKPRDQVATRIPFSGEFGETDVGILATIGNLIRHGFGRALSERLEGQIFAPSDEGVLKPDKAGGVAGSGKEESKRAEDAEAQAERSGTEETSAPRRPFGPSGK
ncbi:hypothetical protein CMV30_04115 [Nibricoccus aquaticus]|uniref:DUF748 domain-containing protein n=1 Tax=Nibricoccus aquaticus TaxID=2576891 RepID=A0A290QH52_9BACT|nr:DUF748 domain-containing protein [Nibricoccus aquaticus]ATC63202.1 hypothetical protein CMV30_04115 [Nibricoccus aquaticus]